MAASAFSNGKYYLNIRSGYMAPVTLHCSYGDRGETVTFYILDGSDAFDLTGAVVSVHGTRKDQANFGPFACTVSEDSVSFKLQSSMTAVEGAGIAELVIAKGGVTIGTCNFAILVEKSAFPTSVTYDSDPSVYEDIFRYVISSQSTIVDNTIAAANSYAKSYTDGKISTEKAQREAADASEVTKREAADTALSNRISNLVVAAGGSNITEVVDARVNFAGVSQTTLLKRLKLFLEYDVIETVNEVTYG